MATSFELTLDTTPPHPEFGDAEWVEEDVLEVPYTVDEPGVVEAYFGATPMTFGAGVLRFTGEQAPGLITVITKDDVLNTAEWTLLVEAMRSYGGRGAAAYGGQGLSTYDAEDPADYGEDNGSTYGGRGSGSYAD